MSDILERLKKRAKRLALDRDLITEAIAEIERLRKIEAALDRLG